MVGSSPGWALNYVPTPVEWNGAFANKLDYSDFFVALAGVWQQPSYKDDAAAAAGGVQLGFPYRNGNFLLVRLS